MQSYWIQSTADQTTLERREVQAPEPGGGTNTGAPVCSRTQSREIIAATA